MQYSPLAWICHGECSEDFRAAHRAAVQASNKLHKGVQPDASTKIINFKWYSRASEGQQPNSYAFKRFC